MLLNKADDAYIALLNYCSTPLQHRLGPAELLMGRKLRTRIPTLPKQHIPEGSDTKKFQEKDAKQKQKDDFDRRHRARPLPQLKKGDTVWIKTPTNAEAVAVSQPSPPSSQYNRSYSVQTKRGIQRRNRVHLRYRNNSQQLGNTYLPKATSTLPEQPYQQQENCRTSEVQADVDFQTVNQEAQSCASIQSTPTVVTKSGRRVRLP